MNPPIIDHRDRLPKGRRGAAHLATALAWGLYAWLWLPLVTFVAWIVGLRTAYVRLYLDEQAVDPFILLALPVIALLCALLLIGWAEYNRARFSGNDRRRKIKDAEQERVDAGLGATAELARRMHGARIVTVALDEDARPVAAIVGRG